MACSRYVLINTGSTVATFNYRKCDDSMWEYQVELNPGQTKNIWFINNTFSIPQAYQEIVEVQNYGDFPPTTITATPSQTATPTPSPTQTATQTPTNTTTNTQTPTQTQTPTDNVTDTPTPSPTETPTATPTPTNTETPTPTNTETPTETPTPTQTETPTNTPSQTPTSTPIVNLIFTNYTTSDTEIQGFYDNSGPVSLNFQSIPFPVLGGQSLTAQHGTTDLNPSAYVSGSTTSTFQVYNNGLFSYSGTSSGAISIGFNGGGALTPLDTVELILTD